MLILIKNRDDIMKEKIYAFYKGIATIGLYILLQTAAISIFYDFIKSNNHLKNSIGMLCIYIFMLIGLAIFYRKKLISDFKNFKKENVNIALKNWIIGLGVMIISNIILTQILNNIAVNESANRELLTNFPISNFFIMVLIAPLIEEITFRASFQKAFSNWLPFSIFTGLLFGFFHIADLKSITEYLFIIPYGALGFFFAKAIYETNNIYTSYIAHVIHNFMCVSLILLMGVL